MKIKILTLSLFFLSFFNIAFGENKDSVISVLRNVLVENNKSIIELQKDNDVLKEKIVGVQTENDKRFTILLWALGIIFTIIAGVIVLNIHSTHNIAKKEVSKEIVYYTDKFKELEIKGEKMISSLTYEQIGSQILKSNE